ncbi:hypothetical protein MWN34_16910 [Ancylobacter sp. 6x-1]|uniref:Uncharacterized protein n=1 Tax=Ancylobacter crimeensis TaxID=2579147 RepID=A0ABT0DF38_9HYPH|nr:hypothetical protein [Ancylobacter crimeensis]MCK0198583.1 hypothetical protein [Ancylobacter crimeensis]
MPNRITASLPRPSAPACRALLTAVLLSGVTMPALAQTAAPVPPPAPAPQVAPAPPAKPDAAKVPEKAPAPPVKPAEAEAPKPVGGMQPEVEDAAMTRDMQRVAACKEQALARLKQKSPSIADIFIDVDGLTIAEANQKLGDTEVKGVLMGEAYIQRDRTDHANRFLCLTGADGKVLFTFFTER